MEYVTDEELLEVAEALIEEFLEAFEELAK